MATIIPSFSLIPLFHRFCNTNKCKFAISFLPRARVAGVLHFSLSQVSHFLVYCVVNDSVIAVWLSSLTIWEPLFLKKSFRGVEIWGWRCWENSQKRGWENNPVWHLWQQKNNIAVGRRARTRMCVCMRAYAYDRTRMCFDIAPLPSVTLRRRLQASEKLY